MKGSRRALYCACRRDSILAHGLCPTRYTLKRRDASYFGGLREEVLKRDGYSCRGCGAPGRDAMPRWSAPKWLLSEMNPILLELWPEKHPQGLEQFVLNFETCTESDPYPNLCLGRYLIGTL